MLVTVSTRVSPSTPMATPSAATSTTSSAPGRQVLADEVGPDGQLAVAPVDQHGELHRPGPPEVVQGVEGGPDRAAGEEHVVDQHDDPPGRGRRACRWPPRAAPAAARCRRGRGRRRAARAARARRRRSGAIASASRSASQTPPVWRPTSTTPSTPRLRSTISWAMRVAARWTSAAVMTWLRAWKTPPLGGVRRRSRTANVVVLSSVRASQDPLHGLGHLSGRRTCEGCRVGRRHRGTGPRIGDALRVDRHASLRASRRSPSRRGPWRRRRPAWRPRKSRSPAWQVPFTVRLTTVARPRRPACGSTPGPRREADRVGSPRSRAAAGRPGRPRPAW